MLWKEHEKKIYLKICASNKDSDQPSHKKDDNAGNFFSLHLKAYVVGTHSKCLIEVLLMRAHIIFFLGELEKIIPELSSNSSP